MTLTTHGIIGAAVATLFPASYPLAWGTAFVSHFAADAVPHWDYHTNSMKKALNPLASDFVITKNSAIDLVKIGFDFCLGLLLGVFLFSNVVSNPWLLLGGAFFGILPDPLQFAYWKIRREPLRTLQRLHVGIHAKNRILDWRIGVLIQVMIVLVVAYTFSQLYLTRFFF